MQRDWPAIAAERRRQVDDHLRLALARVRSAPDSLRSAMDYGLLAPGKRVRPLLCGFACEASGGSWEESLPAGCAVEMVHAYSLIHDDLPAMDDDDLRRGRPTVHKKFGEALAILTGDALLTLAFQMLAESYRPEVAASCCRELASAAGACGMVGGQVDDLTWDGKILGSPREPTLEALQAVHAAKTGALFRASVRMGFFVSHSLASGCSHSDNLAALDRFSECFGLAFQITDDLLDVEGEADETGKRVGKDLSRGKLTYPGFLGVETTRQHARFWVEEAKRALRTFGSAGEALCWMVEALMDRRK